MANELVPLDWTVCDFCGEAECDGAACGGAERAASIAPAVRVTVRREGGPARVELYDEAAAEWTPCLPGAVRAVRVEAGRAVLTFAGGERVEIGAPGGAEGEGEGAPPTRAPLDHILGMLEGERPVEALRERAGGERPVEDRRIDGLEFGHVPPPPAPRPWEPGDPEPANGPPFYVHAPVPGPDPWATACGRRVPRDALAWPGLAEPDCPACREKTGLETAPVVTWAWMPGVPPEEARAMLDAVLAARASFVRCPAVCRTYGERCDKGAGHAGEHWQSGDNPGTF